MAKINWKLIAFWAVLWWMVYSAPTEGWLSDLLQPASTMRARTFDDF